MDSDLRLLCTRKEMSVHVPVPIWSALFWLHGTLTGVSLVVVGWRVAVLRVIFAQLSDLFLAISMLALVIYVSWLVFRKAREQRNGG